MYKEMGKGGRVNLHPPPVNQLSILADVFITSG